MVVTIMHDETITLLNPIILNLDIESLNRRVDANLELIELTLETLENNLQPKEIKINNTIEFLTYLRDDILCSKNILDTLDKNTRNDELLIKLDLETYFKIKDTNITR